MKRSSGQKLMRVQLNNRGLSLVELIVAILILAIIATPLLQVFLSAAKTNQVNMQNLNAETVAENIMEAVKAYGVEGTAKEVYKRNNSPGVTKCFGITMSAVDNSMKADGVTSHHSVAVAPGTGELVFVPSDKKVYDYALSGLTEGSETFSVDIQFSSNYKVDDEGNTDYNKGTVYDYDAFAKREEGEQKTAYINPLITTNYYDELAIEWFWSNNKKYKQNLYNAEVTRVNSQRLAEDKKHEKDPSYEVHYEELPDPNDLLYKPLQTYADVVAQISREMVLTISYGDEYNYKLSSSLQYSIDESLVGTGNTYREYDAFCPGVEYDNLQYVYLFYVPFPYLTKSAYSESYRTDIDNGIVEAYKTTYMVDKIVSDATYLNKQSIKIINNTNLNQLNAEGVIANPLEVYVAVQGGTLRKTDGALATSVEGANKPTVYSNIGLSDPTYKSGLIKTKGSDTKQLIYSVTIIVKNSKGEEVKKVTSTISQ